MMIYRNQIVWVLSHCSTNCIFISKISTSSFDSGWGGLSKMKTLKTLCIATSILASSSLFAETAQPQQVNEIAPKTQPYGDNPSLGRVLLYKTGKGIQNLGDNIQGASEKTSNKISEKWKNTKEFTAEKAEVVQQKADTAKAFTETKIDQAKQNITSSRNGENIPIEQGELSKSSTTIN